MGRYMIPCCCVCGRAAKCWHDDEWMAAGGLQDFCPEHAAPEMVEYCAREEHARAEAGGGEK